LWNDCQLLDLAISENQSNCFIKTGYLWSHFTLPICKAEWKKK